MLTPCSLLIGIRPCHHLVLCTHAPYLQILKMHQRASNGLSWGLFCSDDGGGQFLTGIPFLEACRSQSHFPRRASISCPRNAEPPREVRVDSNGF